MFLSLAQKETTSSTSRYLARFAEAHGLFPPERNIYECAMNKAQRCLRDGVPAMDGEVFLADARDMFMIAPGSVDLIVCSPPYMNVLNYVVNNRLRLWWLKRDPREERQRLILTQSEDKYRTFIRAALSEMFRVLRPDSAAVIVVGDVKQGSGKQVRMLNSAQLIGDEALKVGFEVDEMISDGYALHNRSMLVYNRLKYGYNSDEDQSKSSVPIDRCLVLAKGKVRWREANIPWALDMLRSKGPYAVGLLKRQPRTINHYKTKEGCPNRQPRTEAL